MQGEDKRGVSVLYEVLQVAIKVICGNCNDIMEMTNANELSKTSVGIFECFSCGYEVIIKT